MGTETPTHQASPRQDRRTAWWMVMPMLAFITLLILVPIAGTAVNSLFLDVAFRSGKFVFFQNYSALLADDGFVQAARFTVLFVAVSVPLELLLGLAMAMLLDAKTPLRTILRTCVLIPWAVPAAVSGRIWELIYGYSHGLANSILMTLGLADVPINWLGTSEGAFAAVVLADVWKTTPFVAIILLASLQAVPSQLLEAAKVDGAGALQAFRLVTLPMIRSGVIVAALFRMIDACRIFDLLYVLTHGGPGGATTSLSLYAHRYFLMSDFGYGSTISVILFIIALALAIVTIRLGRFESEST